MPDYIKREDAMNAAADYIKWLNPDSPAREIFALQIQTKISKIPAADVVERKHGKWIPIPDKDAPYYEKSDWIGCSECRQYAHYTRISDKPILSSFCPNCGAKMDGDSDV